METVIRVSPAGPVAPEGPVATLLDARVERNCKVGVTIAKVLTIASIIFSIPLYVFGVLKSENDSVSGGLLISAAVIVSMESAIALKYLCKAS